MSYRGWCKKCTRPDDLIRDDGLCYVCQDIEDGVRDSEGNIITPPQMTVGMLIKRLQEYPPNAPLFVRVSPEYKFTYHPVEYVTAPLLHGTDGVALVARDSAKEQEWREARLAAKGGNE